MCWFAWLQSRALFRKTKPRRTLKLPWLAPSANSCFIKCWFLPWSWVNGDGGKIQGPNKEPFRCSIQNIKVTESFCTKPRGAKFCMNEGGMEVPHPPGGAIHGDQRPSTREKTYYSWPPCPASSKLFPRRVPCILSNFILKSGSYLELCC